VAGFLEKDSFHSNKTMGYYTFTAFKHLQYIKARINFVRPKTIIHMNNRFNNMNISKLKMPFWNSFNSVLVQAHFSKHKTCIFSLIHQV